MSGCFPRRFHAHSLSFTAQAVALAFWLTALAPAPAAAQGDDEEHFGIGVSFSPNWKSRTDLLVTVGLEDVGAIEGTEFTIGFVRGRTRAGDWGVSFVRKPFKDATTVFEDFEAFECGPGCSGTSTRIETTTFEQVYLRGVEVHWSPVFITISNRVQIGMNVAGGIAVPEGTIHRNLETIQTQTFQGQTQSHPFVSSESLPANEVMFGKVPLFKVEVQGGVILAPGLKFRISGGLNNPGTGVRIGAVYLIGAN